MKLSEYPIGTLAYFAGLSIDGRVIKSNQIIAHDHDEVYAPLGHDHDEVYAPLGHDHDEVYAPSGHDHDEVYAPLAHSHDGVYAPADSSLRLLSFSWSGGGVLPYNVRIASEVWAPIGQAWGLIYRSDGYSYGVHINSGTVVNISLHTNLSYTLTLTVYENRTYINIPSGASVLNASGQTYDGFLIG